jgi:hypothetical protein
VSCAGRVSETASPRRPKRHSREGTLAHWRACERAPSPTHSARLSLRAAGERRVQKVVRFLALHRRRSSSAPPRHDGGLLRRGAEGRESRCANRALAPVAGCALGGHPFRPSGPAVRAAHADATVHWERQRVGARADAERPCWVAVCDGGVAESNECRGAVGGGRVTWRCEMRRERADEHRECSKRVFSSGCKFDFTRKVLAYFARSMAVYRIAVRRFREIATRLLMCRAESLRQRVRTPNVRADRSSDCGARRRAVSADAGNVVQQERHHNPPAEARARRRAWKAQTALEGALLTAAATAEEESRATAPAAAGTQRGGRRSDARGRLRWRGRAQLRAARARGRDAARGGDRARGDRDRQVGAASAGDRRVRRPPLRRDGSGARTLSASLHRASR